MEMDGILISTKYYALWEIKIQVQIASQRFRKETTIDQKDAGTRVKLLAAVVGSPKSIRPTDNPQWTVYPERFKLRFPYLIEPLWW